MINVQKGNIIEDNEKEGWEEERGGVSARNSMDVNTYDQKIYISILYLLMSQNWILIIRDVFGQIESYFVIQTDRKKCR